MSRSTNGTPNPVTGVPNLDPFLWRNRTMLDLGTLGGVFGYPVALNNRGQVVGYSSLAADPGACLTSGAGSPNCDPFLWDHGRLIDLFTSTIGGSPSFVFAINDAGENVGAAAFPNAPFDAYVWRKGVATDLGHLSDCSSLAFAINSHGQIVGGTLSCADGNHTRAFLWENGTMVDLDTLVPAGSPLQLVEAVAINDRGEIAGNGVPLGVARKDFNTLGHAFLLLPCDEHHPGVEGCDYSLVDAPATAHVSPAPVTQHPAALTPSSRMPVDMLNRFRFPWGRRDPGSGTGPAPDQQQEHKTVTDPWVVDNVLEPGPIGGRCTLDNKGNLTGVCSAPLPGGHFGCRIRKNACPTGKKAKKPGWARCCYPEGCGQPFPVDLGRICWVW